MSCCDDNENAAEAVTRRKPDWLLRGSLTGVLLLYAVAATGLSSAIPLLALHHLAHAVFELINTIWWGLALGMLMIAIIGRIPRDFVVSALGTERGAVGIWRATLLGVLLDLCSHGVLMVGARLYERGASTAQVMAFLVSSPWNSLSFTLILIALVGLPWTVAFIVLSMAVAFLTGLIFQTLIQRGVLPENPYTAPAAEDFDFRAEARAGWRAIEWSPGYLREVLVDGVKGSRMVMRWILFGVLLAAIVRALVPPELFADLFGPTLLGLGATVLAATVIEVCSEGSTPIAADLLTRAQAPGNAFAFLMGGVATDYTEVMVLKEASGSWKVALFLPLVTLPQIILLAALINLLSA